MNVSSSAYLTNLKPDFIALRDLLLEHFSYVSILATDVDSKRYSVSGRGTAVAENNQFGKRGFLVRVYDGTGYLEYSATSLKAEDFPRILVYFKEGLKNMAEPFTRCETLCAKDTPASFSKSTTYEIDPASLGDEEIVKRLTSVREKILALDERLMDASASFSYQTYHKIFLSKNRDMEENIMYADTSAFVLARKGQEIKDAFKSASNLGGAEVLGQLEGFIPELVKSVTDLLSAEPMIPGEYECICTPEVTGMIVHEAFGHGVEMDMFVKNRALAKEYIGKPVASELITMKDGAATTYDDVATYFFDDEGNLATDTIVIDKGILVSGIADELSASRLGIAPTGNGRRESVDHKAYTRMTNTFFTEGTDEVEDMIKSVKYGMYLECPTSGMEDPKNWGIQCMVSFAREIKDGAFTGRIFSPIVLTGYVPDLLKSITMVSKKVEHCGSGYCGKGHKEWVKVSDGGPYIKATIRLG